MTQFFFTLFDQFQVFMIFKEPYYISIEGCDGSGKTSLVNELFLYLKDRKKILVTNEFASDHSKFSKDLIRIAVSEYYEIDEIAGQILFAAIARQHQVKVISPALKSGNWDIVLSDRCIDTNFAYGLAHGLSMNELEKIFYMSYKETKLPDLTILLNIEPELAQERLSFRSAKIENKSNRIEKKGIAFFQKVQKNYLDLAHMYPERISTIDVTENKTKNKILSEVIDILTSTNIL